MLNRMRYYSGMPPLTGQGCRIGVYIAKDVAGLCKLQIPTTSLEVVYQHRGLRYFVGYESCVSLHRRNRYQRQRRCYRYVGPYYRARLYPTIEHCARCLNLC